jgi:hypothetical protein
MFESHVTVANLTDGEFAALCYKLHVKPVIIEHDTGSNNLRQMMTSKFHFTDDQDRALAEMRGIAANFEKVIRCKLEYIVKCKDPLPDHKYLEFHTKFELTHNQVDKFRSEVASLGINTSDNVLRHPADPTRCFQFATARSRETWKQILTLQEYKRVNTIMECVVYDDAPDLDVGWTPCLSCSMKMIPESEFHYLLDQGVL